MPCVLHVGSIFRPWKSARGTWLGVSPVVMLYEYRAKMLSLSLKR